uniref:Uncharacterized protein n=1 Tax=Steinernema glaseri TaxID=37863 RepID=A0A1I7YT56_9BILA
MSPCVLPLERRHLRMHAPVADSFDDK